MSFTGDLEHLPIVDVIQLLHATKKSGTLTVSSSGKGESQLVFKDGYIVSANHANNSVRIGKLLVEIGAITGDVLELALQEQKTAGAGRKPLLSTLIEQGRVDRKDAFRALETLIEMTIVEVLTWPGGTFSLDVDHIVVSDEYRYFPEKLDQEIVLNTQNVLMDALRIYDEKKRDGVLEKAFAEADAEVLGVEPAEREEESFTLSAEDLGLDDFDRLERRIPGVFAGLVDHDPDAAERRRLGELAPELTSEEREGLLALLRRPEEGDVEPTARTGAVRAAILFSGDALFRHMVAGVCRHDGISVFATNEEPDLDPIIDQSLGKGIVPVLVFDSPQGEDGGFSGESVAVLRRRIREKYPRVAVLQLASPADARFTLQAYADGVRAVLPRSRRPEGSETFLAELERFLLALRAVLQGCVGEAEEPPLAGLLGNLAALRELREAPAVTLTLLKQVSSSFARALMLIVGPGELIAERGIGIGDGAGASSPLGFRIPLGEPSLLRRAVEEGLPFLGSEDDAVLREHLHTVIGAPSQPTILLLPLRSRGRTLALAYADFGEGEPAPVRVEPLEALAGQAGLQLELIACRKKLEKCAP